MLRRYPFSAVLLVLLLALSMIGVQAQDVCPAVTVADLMGVPAGQYPNQYELAEFHELAGCTLTFSENPEIAALNAEVNGAEAALPAVADRLPVEALVYPPYLEIGTYGGRLNGISRSPESGTSHFLSTRHVNLVRFAEDLQTIVPNIATAWQYNEDFTEITFTLREGHKWSDGAPFTAEDVAFWYNDIKLNTELYENVESTWVFGGEPMVVEALDPVTVRFSFAAPAPNFLALWARTYIQPFQPKHFLSQFMPAYNDQANEVAQSFGFEDWRGLFNLYFNDWKDTYHPFSGPEGTGRVVPTLESHILVEETPELRRYVANPYFHIVDTAGNQLPYYNESYETFSEDNELTILKLINGEIDYKDQTVDLPRFPELKENEANGGYRVFLAPELGGIVYYTFNQTSTDPEKARIFGDLRFRQAMSLAINRPEINEIVYLGQGMPMQTLPIDPSTVDYIPAELTQAFVEFDVEAANALLDDMGLTARDSDGFRLNLAGEPWSLFFQYAAQGGPSQVHELVAGYWEAVGINVELREVTSDFYRTESSQNRHDIAAWINDGSASVLVVTQPGSLIPPFGDFLNTRTGIQWAEWVESNGATGIEPPADILRLWELADEIRNYPLGTEDAARVGLEVTNIFINNMIHIGVVGNVPGPVYVNDRVGNFGEFTAKTFQYYWSYPYRSTQWFIRES